MKLKHRNSQRRIYVTDGIYFTTSNTKHWFPFFKEPIFCELFVENLRICKKLKQFKLYSWFLGYDHFHLQLRPSDGWDYSGVMHSIKRNIARDINKIIHYSAGEDPNLRRFRRYHNHHTNYFIIGEHMDLRLRRWKTKFCLKYGNNNPFPHFQWLHSFHPPEHTIRYGRATTSSATTAILIFIGITSNGIRSSMTCRRGGNICLPIRNIPI